MRRLSALTVQREGDWVMVAVTANAFLHHMVRNIAGALLLVGQGKEEPGWMRELLEARDRRRGPATAPASAAATTSCSRVSPQNLIRVRTMEGARRAHRPAAGRSAHRTRRP